MKAACEPSRLRISAIPGWWFKPCPKNNRWGSICISPLGVEEKNIPNHHPNSFGGLAINTPSGICTCVQEHSQDMRIAKCCRHMNGIHLWPFHVRGPWAIRMEEFVFGQEVSQVLCWPLLNAQHAEKSPTPSTHPEMRGPCSPIMRKQTHHCVFSVMGVAKLWKWRNGVAGECLVCVCDFVLRVGRICHKKFPIRHAAVIMTGWITEQVFIWALIW